MKILVISQYFWPENFRVNDVAADLARRGHEVTVLTGIPNYPTGSVFPAFGADPDAFEAFGGCRIVRVPMMVRGQARWRLIANYLSFAVSASLIGWWKLRKNAFDVIFTFQVSPVTVGLPAVLLRRVKRAPLVFWVQDIWPETLAAIGVVRSPRVLDAIGHLVSFIYERCDHILVQSESFIPMIRARTRASSAISHLPNWAQNPNGTSVAMDVPRLASSPGAFNIVFTGNLGDAQDFPALLDAAAYLRHLPNVHWYLVGDGSMADWIREQLMQRNLAEVVTLLGQFPPEAMDGFYAQAGALLVSLRAAPLFSLTVPSKVQSYLAAGRPILGMLDGEGAAVIRRAEAGLTSRAGDSRGLADAVMVMMDMPDAARERMGASGRAHAAATFDRERLISQLEVWMRKLRPSFATTDSQEDPRS